MIGSKLNLNDKRNKKLLTTFGIFSLLFTFILVAFVWAFTNELEESVPGMGEMVPAGKLRRVMSPINGQIISFQVKENQAVKKGDVLMELDPDYAAIEKAGVTKQVDNIDDQIKALEAAVTNGSAQGLSPLQSAWLASARQATQSRLSTARMEIVKSEHLYKESLARQKQAKELLASSEAMIGKYENLYNKGGLPKKEYEEYKQQYLQRQGEVAAMNEEVQARALDWEQAKRQPATIEGEFRQTLLDKMTDLKRQMTAQESELGKVDVSLEYQQITAPIDGLVHGLEVHGEGEYVTTGTPLLSIVPEGAELVAEIKVTNTDLSYIHLNQKALLQIDAFPYQQFGKLEGFIESISPSTVKDPQGFPFYLVRIKPDRIIMKKNGEEFPLRSGMTVNAQMITRHKNIISFFTEPIEKRLEQAFRDPSKY